MVTARLRMTLEQGSRHLRAVFRGLIPLRALTTTSPRIGLGEVRGLNKSAIRSLNTLELVLSGAGPSLRFLLAITARLDTQ